jgi:8-oxo-dGTP pyrophosphatase MutT (NUDIX family)
MSNNTGERMVRRISPAATVIIAREVATDPEGGLEIFMLRRTSKASFAADMYVFPGGRVEGDDHLHSYDELREGPCPAQAAQQAAMGNEWRGYWIAAIRECFEESGLLLAYDSNGKLFEYENDATAEKFNRWRHDIHEGRCSLADVCQKASLKLAVDHVHYFNRWITPEGRPRRFDTRFFIAEAPMNQRGEHDKKETVDSLWISPNDALKLHAEEKFGLMAVTRIQLESLLKIRSLESLSKARLDAREFPIIRPVLPTLRDA